MTSVEFSNSSENIISGVARLNDSRGGTLSVTVFGMAVWGSGVARIPS
jgi:hypothetical protein